ncbi:putative histone H2A.1 [Pseudolycoriella hygida]|uniref:Histone H2A n=1 Tax=Pseudolycoriella hygida TaxID=35572 RepID=A0A9Q0N4S8_9DIPT|nr:putative histone H2A.1 [Pseudolycoriella hygida]
MSVPLSRRAGLVFPVHQFRKKMKEQRVGKFVKKESAIYLAAVLEYLVAEVLEVSADLTWEIRKKRLIPRHIFLAIQADEELSKLCQNVTIMEGGVVPLIHQVLQSKKTNSSSKRNRKSTEN